MGACCSTGYEEYGNAAPDEERRYLLGRDDPRERERDGYYREREREEFELDERRGEEEFSRDRRRRSSSLDRDDFDERERREYGNSLRDGPRSPRRQGSREDWGARSPRRRDFEAESTRETEEHQKDEEKRRRLIDPRWKPKGGDGGYEEDSDDQFDSQSEEEREELIRKHRAEVQEKRRREEEEQERRRQADRRRYIRKVVLIQACVRRWSARGRFLARRRAIITIQSAIRMQQAKELLIERRKNVLALQAGVRAWLVRQEYMKKRRAAIKIQSIIRGTQERKAFHVMKEKFQKRFNIVNEILQTEVSYYDVLCIIINHFRDPLLAIVRNNLEDSGGGGEKNRRSKEYLEGEGKWVTKEHIKAIFSDISLIAEIHRELSQELLEITSSWNHYVSRIGPTFLNMLDSMKLYTGYVNNYDKAVKTLGECLQNTQFRNFIQRAEQEASTPERIVDLGSLLINPVQRIPRYEMLLKDLLRHTPPEHVDYEDIEKAVVKVQDTARYINEHKRSVENIERMKDIKEQLRGLRGKRIKKYLGSPEIELLKEGKATRIKDKGKETKDYLFLFNRMIVRSQEETKKKFHSLRTKYRHNEPIKLKHTRVAAEPGSAWSLTTASGKKLVWKMSTKKERDEWVAAIEELQKKRNSRNEAGGSSSSSSSDSEGD